ncbi:transmembrane protein, putative [Medicago truncatula]|uniref:Transmembrane protein, putative n=2 Tax=Medicago truncatula TaxID=3880 RepID=A0A072TME7_MEDTR|nr:transmembrane protein, putative [Medicago truncatula]
MHDSIFSFSFILLFFIFISSIIIPLFLSSLRNKTPPTIPKPVSTRNPVTHAPAILSPADSHLNRPDDNDSTPTLFSKPASHDDPNQFLESGQCVMNDDMVERDHFVSDTRPELGALDLFTPCSSFMQKKMKPQYDNIVKCNESKKLTISQVVQFANSLVDARSELQHKAEATQRKFVIAKALLCKADISSFDRLRQQVYKLELERKRLEEDAFVYNWLQQQLKLSPAYNRMLEIGVSMEKEKSCKMGERKDEEFSDISFEELLTQEKKDSFWQRNGKSRQCSS